MAQRYVRVRNYQGQTYYGLLQLNRTVVVLDAPPWLGGKPTEMSLEHDSYQILFPCSPSKMPTGRSHPNALTRNHWHTWGNSPSREVYPCHGL